MVTVTDWNGTFGSWEKLQWSHGRLTVVTAPRPSVPPRGGTASMEPRSFNRGDLQHQVERTDQDYRFNGATVV